MRSIQKRKLRLGAHYVDFPWLGSALRLTAVPHVLQNSGAALAFGTFAALGLGATFSGESTAAMGQRRKMSEEVWNSWSWPQAHVKFVSPFLVGVNNVN